MTNSLFAGNGAAGARITHMMTNFGLHVENCTFVGNQHGLVYDWDWARSVTEVSSQGDTAEIAANIFAANRARGLWAVAPFDYNVECNDFYGNDSGDFDFSGQGDTTDNYYVDPLFCDTAGGDYQIETGSFLAPANNPCGILIGAGGVGCECCVLRGDLDHNGTVNVSDLAYLVDLLFRGGPDAICSEEADIKATGTVTVSDLSYLIDLLFRGGPLPPPC
jgi:hypothetical protein